MLPTRLELRNFLAYRQPDPLILDGIHLACLTGPNGAGKIVAAGRDHLGAVGQGARPQ